MLKKAISLAVATVVLLGTGALAREPGKMKVLSGKKEQEGIIRVRTTAAFFDFDLRGNKISITCLIPKEKPGGEVSLDISLKGLKVISVDQDLCRLAGDELEAQVDFGSILKLSARQPFTAQGSKDASFVVKGVKDRTRWYVSVNPAREFDWDALYSDRIVYMGNSNERHYASDRAIKIAQEHYDANILLL